MTHPDPSNLVDATRRFRKHATDNLANLGISPHYPQDTTGGGPPGGGDMEQRLSRLEDDVKDLRGDVKDLRKDMTDVKVTLARIEAALSSKVDYKWLTAYILGLAALVLREEIASLFTG